ncbi:NADH-quinone oxidoreductase subunit I [Thiohalomonas denitrificans]|uniref:4Fe-4S dicluster domain-containing protein n=1 Tax=Thiohalomonas denitrificans TaxID=415747 RepID=A0A1G5PZT4_9GAMM|nr:4Fe-4S dicluster domain-containing protein [Thiohalomonas denitrificans]SCZ54579.1 4Fe-4S dicluster domain-containing protein [Thiohalomonas denitrificans]
MAIAMETLPEVRIQRCVRYRFRYSHCSRCADGCPPGALTPDEEGVTLDAARCSGCGLCGTACPTAVFEPARLPLAALVKPETPSLSIVCAPSGLRGEVRVPCLGDLDLALLASLAQREIAVTLRVAGHCENCANAPVGGERVEGLAGALDELGKAASDQGLPWSAPLVETEDTGRTHQADRRQLFRRWANRVVQSSHDQVELEVPAFAVRAAAHFVPARRRLAEVVLGRFEAVPESTGLALLLGVGSIDARAGRCTGCESCARVCPSGALKIFEGDSRWELQFRIGQCLGCGVCVEACGAGALTLHHHWQPAADAPVALHSLRRFLCESCGRFFIGLEEDTCPVCSDDEDNFEAIFG